jgi:uncharacterized protein (DUF427 family)
MKASLHGQVIAESDNVREAGGYTYFPREAVKMNLLAKSPKTGSDLECPHGVQFYDVTVNGAEAKRAAWSYEAPKPAMRQVDCWIGFWEDVKVE